MDPGSADRSQRGQSTVEWIGLVLLIALAVTGFAAAVGVGLPGADLARALGAKLVCATRLTDCAGELDQLAVAYGGELAATVREKAPDLLYELGMLELPVDYRECRRDPCSLAAAAAGAVSKTEGGLAATAFTHLVDCRPEPVIVAQGPAPDCSGARAGHLYIQYWLYYPDSQTEPFGERGYHRDDWESFQVRIGDQVAARASSHHSYNYDGGVENWPTDAGLWTKPGWGPYSSGYHVSSGSHAGHVGGERDEPRYTPGARLALIPVEEIGAAGSDDALFEVVPPWLKDVYLDPESEET